MIASISVEFHSSFGYLCASGGFSDRLPLEVIALSQTDCGACGHFPFAKGKTNDYIYRPHALTSCLDVIHRQADIRRPLNVNMYLPVLGDLS